MNMVIYNLIFANGLNNGRYRVGMYNLFIIIVTAVVLGSCSPVAGFSGPGRSFHIKNQKNTFLILEVKDYIKPNLIDQAPVGKDNRSFFFYIEATDYDEGSWLKGFYYPVNPSHEYFRSKNDGLYRNIVWQFFSNFRREEFLFGCKYEIPMPSGVNEFKFMIFDYDKRKRGYVQKNIDLSEGHSIRVIVSISEDKSSENLRQIKDSQNWPSSYRFLGEQIINLDFQIGKTSQGEEDSPCSNH